MEGGDIHHADKAGHVKKDDSGGESIYGLTFPDENFHLKHQRPYLLSMANRGHDSNGSMFFITLDATYWLDDRHVVFGEVLEGQNVIKNMEAVKMIKNNKVTSKNVVIANSGELDHDVVREESKHQISMPEDIDGTLEFHDPKEPKKPGHLRFVVISDTHTDDECF